MRQSIDYREYDPANFTQDHPDDPVIADARSRADELSERLKHVELQGTPQEQRRQIEQQFDEMQSSRLDVEEFANSDERKKALVDFTNEKTDAIHEQANERIASARRPEGQVASWQGTKEEVARAREGAPHDPEYQQRAEQLAQFQAARSEAASREIHEVQQRLLEERGLDKVEAAPPERASVYVQDNLAGGQQITEDVMARAEESRAASGMTDDRLSRAMQAYQQAGSPPPNSDGSSQNKAHEMER